MIISVSPITGLAGVIAGAEVTGLVASVTLMSSSSSSSSFSSGISVIHPILLNRLSLQVTYSYTDILVTHQKQTYQVRVSTELTAVIFSRAAFILVYDRLAVLFVCRRRFTVYMSTQYGSESAVADRTHG